MPPRLGDHTAMKRVALGETGLMVPAIAVGTWAFGDARYWHYGEEHGPSDIVDAFVGAASVGCRFFDTAEVYGHGESEKILGYLVEKLSAELADEGRPADFFLATKFGLLPGRDGARALRPALLASLRRLRRRRIDLHQIHWPDLAMASIPSLMDAMADAVEEGLVGAVGVSNFGASELREAHRALARRGIPLASHQVRYNLLDRSVERDGVRDACRELGVSLLAYSPLDQGVLGGRYDREHVPSAPRGTEPWFSAEAWIKAEVVLTILREIAAREGCEIADVAIAWVLAQGATPIVGVRSRAHAEAIPRALDVRLRPSDITRLDAATAG